MAQSAFDKWFRTFLEEKEVDLGEYVTNKDGISMQVGNVVTYITHLPAASQELIKSEIVMVDFKNIPMGRYFLHVSNSITSEMKAQIDELEYNAMFG